ncbi:hypothetical protein M0R45_034521 [Rubus argutus]|uniref:Uncharacterized protein n=1 Tax=Rubus argutus TaxID=59490 RepID=A0AAW1VS51_RUBAR
MGKPSGILSESFASTASISEDVPESHVNDVLCFLKGVGICDPVPDHCDTKDFYSTSFAASSSLSTFNEAVSPASSP